jgi:hypothetical protein
VMNSLSPYCSGCMDIVSVTIFCLS